MIQSLKKHHLGVVISPEKVSDIEQSFSTKFIMDIAQGARVCMVDHPHFQIPVEYIVKEGRASNYELGFHHVCYEVKDLDELNSFKEFLRAKKMGYRLTKLDKSPTKECNFVMFFVVHQIGIIEINIERMN
jgi:hypothetical protein